MRRPAAAALTVVLLGGPALGGCALQRDAAPRCDATQRVAIVAQSVPSAAFVPCVDDLAPGWRVSSFDVSDGETRIELRSDRAEHDVDVLLTPSCDVEGATPVSPRTDGVRSYVRLDEVRDRFAGQRLDVFPGGCVDSRFDFARGPHIALVDELDAAIVLRTRREVRRALNDELGVELDD